MLPETLTQRYLLICEGSADKAFMDNLMAARGITGLQVAYPTDRTGGGGREGIGSLLTAAKTKQGFEVIQGILIVADNDDDPATSANIIHAQIGEDGAYAVPNAPLTVAPGFARASGLPPVFYTMLPEDGTNGCLETVLLPVAQRTWPQTDPHVADLLSATGADAWSLTKHAKAMVQCTISSTCEEDPYTPLARLWSRHQRYHIPLNDAAFDSIAQRLRGFAALVGAVP